MKNFTKTFNPFKEEKEKIKTLINGIDANSYNRFETFLKNSSQLTDPEYWLALRKAYVNSDWIDRYEKDILLSFISPRSNKELLMNAQEENILNCLPAKFPVYGAVIPHEYPSRQYGVRWSLDVEVALFFAKKYIRHHDKSYRVVKSHLVHKELVLAIFNERKEKEVIFIR